MKANIDNILLTADTKSPTAILSSPYTKTYNAIIYWDFIRKNELLTTTSLDKDRRILFEIRIGYALLVIEVPYDYLSWVRISFIYSLFYYLGS